jgi:plasmid maintenance system antidote protein VapI
MPMKTKYIPLTDQLRQAILDCGQTRYAISKATGIGQDKLSRFINGERGVSCEVMDKLGEYLGLRIVADKPKKQKGG